MTTTVKLTDLQRIYLRSLIEAGGRLGDSYARRIYDALVRKGYATCSPGRSAYLNWYVATEAGREAVK